MTRPIYVDLPAVSNLVTLATATIQRLVREKAFPKPRQLSSNRVAWLLREVEEWAEERPAPSFCLHAILEDDPQMIEINCRMTNHRTARFNTRKVYLK